jgi:signal transduction histidine kinase
LRELLFTASVTLPLLAGLAWELSTTRDLVSTKWPELLVWAGALALLNLLDLGNVHGKRLTPDVPVAVAAAVILSPALVGLVAFIGTLDSRELRGQISITRAIFNRSQVAISLSAASLITHAWPTPPHGGVAGIAIHTFVALAISTALNYWLVGIMSLIIDGGSFPQLFSNLRLGRLDDFLVTWSAWGIMALLLVAAYGAISTWTIIVFCVPAVLGRQVLERSERALRAEAELDAKSAVVELLSDRISSERRDERLRISAHLHDEIMQPLFQVSLLCTVVEEDLTGGMLLAMEDDVPALKAACDQAALAVRRAVTDLRNSPVGLRGLSETLIGFVRELQAQTPVQIRFQVKDLGDPSESIQLAVYQVAREALLNAVHHSKARTVSIELARDKEFVRLSVEDDGVGFDPQFSERSRFGLLIMKERTEGVGGTLYVDTALGEGTIVAARFPTERPIH